MSLRHTHQSGTLMKYLYVEYDICEMYPAQWAEWVLDPRRKSWWHGRRRRQSRLAQQGLAVRIKKRKMLQVASEYTNSKMSNVKNIGAYPIYLYYMYPKWVISPFQKLTVMLGIIEQHKNCVQKHKKIIFCFSLRVVLLKSQIALPPYFLFIFFIFMDFNRASVASLTLIIISIYQENCAMILC